MEHNLVMSLKLLLLQLVQVLMLEHGVLLLGVHHLLLIHGVLLGVELVINGTQALLDEVAVEQALRLIAHHQLIRVHLLQLRIVQILLVEFR